MNELFRHSYMTHLKTIKCVPCEGGVEKLTAEQCAALLKQLDGWALQGNKLQKEYRFKNFSEAMAFVNKMAAVAESEGHHPDFTVHYNLVQVSIWTHAVNGLTENDFILAAKIDG